ncbi:hypothetical protein M427DRAFT_438139 [Gonapodya prolifera JEL478]|uniref:Histidine kinase/HSP90-like ATPase domain-containing protein n=1 Tax=Gonapodya prolifera (strain JEL478) TaxID=1344416 RepID=A0A139A3C3_GONPJ|nr:hypothetical protein M427DRAFT_438139 [Gonapodya prolifera JEL478]|eukprot:KXS11317.1 hypothetical protein M427DRAFT_438139 [Gonapodya prolifera JEL478]
MDRTNASVEHGSGAGELSANGGRREPGRELAILPAEIARRVHSEQVVSTVVDVVRELIENALDASASRIKLFVVHSGLMSISVSDNGIGIPQNSLGLLFKPHYTSKLVSIDQLPHTTTFGFRGEALYAIAVLADEVEVATMCEGESVGRKIVVGTRGVLKSSAPTPLPASGTTITVRRMFLPHPVRRAHALQHPPTRFRDALQSLVAGYAVECPHVGWVVKGTDAPPPAPAGSTGKKKAGPDAGKGKEWSFSLPATASLVQSARGAFPFLSVGENGGWVIVETERTLPPEDDGDDAPPLAIRVRAIVPKPGQMLPPHPSPPPPIHLNRRTCVSAPPHLSSAVESALARWNDTIPNAPSSAGIKPKKVFSWWSISLSGGNGVDANLSPDKRHILLAAEDDERAAGVVREVVDELYGGYEAKSDEVDTQGTRRNAPPTNTPRARSPPPPLSPARTPLTPLYAQPCFLPPSLALRLTPAAHPRMRPSSRQGESMCVRARQPHEHPHCILDVPRCLPLHSRQRHPWASWARTIYEQAPHWVHRQRYSRRDRLGALLGLL